MATRRGRIAAAVAGVVATAGLAAGAVAATTGGENPAKDLADAINERAGTSITADEVEGAFRDLLEARLDEAVADGRLTREEADEMLERADEMPGLPGLGRHGHGFGPGPDAPRGAVHEAAAAALGLSEHQLRERIEDGDTLAEVAEAEGVARAKLVAAVRAALVKEGVPAARAAEMAGHIVDRDRPGPGLHRHGPRP